MRSARRKSWLTLLLVTCAIAALIYPAGYILTYFYLNAAYTSRLPPTRLAIDSRLRLMAQATVSDDDIPRGYRESTPLLQTVPHSVVRYGRFGLALHVVYDETGQRVLQIIPSYE